MFGKVKTENLPDYLAKIRRHFPEFQEERTLALSDVSRYYSESFWGYAFFHSWAGAIHMALSRGERVTKNDYFGQAEEIGTLINSMAKSPGLRILEVGCGRAFNIHYLAVRFPEHAFIGVDIAERNLDAARKQLLGLSNTTLTRDDFHRLSSIDTGSVDIVFAVESLCHAVSLEQALKSVSRVLKQGGQLVVFDGFRSNSTQESAQLHCAVKYAEQAMAVSRFRTPAVFISSAVSQGLALQLSQDRSEEIMPNLIRLSDFAKAFFKIGPLAKIIMALLPRGLVANAIAGLLMAVTVKSGAHRYMKLVFKKENEA
jgi:ubiquinone/menaquinone biosynthesis C-methylase UbiE